MGYDLFSDIYNKATILTLEAKIKLTQEFKGFSSWKLLKTLLLEYNLFKKTELADQMGYDTEENRGLFRWLSVNRLIKATSFGYVKQPIFTAFLKGLDMMGNEPPAHKFKI